MNISYFQKINNTYNSKSKQETDLYLLNRYVDEYFSDTIDYHVVKRNGEPFELLIVKDTDGNTFKKKIKAKNSTPFNLGDYIEWNGQIWLITLIDPNEKTYHSGYMYLCTVPLRWQNSDGEIIERYAYSEDFTKYSSGTTGNNTITIGDNQYGLTLPIDTETKKLRRDMRFSIDFDEIDIPDVYKLTNRKVNLNNNEYFGRGGVMTLTLSYDSFNANEDEKITLKNGKDVWICNYKNLKVSQSPSLPLPSFQDEVDDLKVAIKGNLSLKIGISNTYKAIVKINNTNVKWDDAFSWNVISNFDVKFTSNRNEITVFTNDRSNIGEAFLLQLLKNNEVIKEIGITVCAII